MKALLAVYRALMQQEIATHVHYRVEVALWAVGLILQPVIYLAVWVAVAQASGGDVAGYGARDFAAYFIVLLVVRHFTSVWVIYTLGGEIRSGALSPHLLRPFHPIHRFVAGNVASKLINLLVIIPTVIGLALIFRSNLDPAPWQIAAFVPAVVFAFSLRMLLDWSIGAIGFWITQVSGINQSYTLAMLFLSGQVAPLDLLPGPLRLAATVLPFRWMVAFPVELLLGRLSPSETLWSFAAQLAWLAIAWAIFGPVWRAGLRRYTAVGA